MKIEMNIQDEIYQNVESVLELIGLDVELAIHIFLKRVILENGLPFNMNTPSPKQEDTDNFLHIDEVPEYSVKRSNNKITPQMVEEIWNAFLMFNKGNAELKPLSFKVSEKTGMNQGSAFIYLMVLSNLVEGTYNTRVIKYADLLVLMKKIKNDLGEKAFVNAIKSLRESVPYWREKIPGDFANKVESYCNSVG